VPRPDIVPPSRLGCFLSLSLLLLARAQGNLQRGDLADNAPPQKLPTGVLLVKGAWSSASDSVTPVPEGGRVINQGYTNPYFGLTYPLSADWTERYSGPPPSDSGYYVLAQIRPADTFSGPSRGTILIAAQDLFFALIPARNALEMVNYTAENLQADYRIEQPPRQFTISGHSFVRLDYGSPVAGLHWRVLATEIRCHIVEFVFTSRDTELAEDLIQKMNKMTLPAEADLTSGMGGGDAPVCIRDYATGENVIKKVDPVFTEQRFNPIPVRIIVNKEGEVRHIHFVSAFPDQARAITEALSQWSVKPYRRDGHELEVETGIMFGRAVRLTRPSSTIRPIER
jgi:hypothetical protein